MYIIINVKVVAIIMGEEDKISIVYYAKDFNANDRSGCSVDYG